MQDARRATRERAGGPCAPQGHRSAGGCWWDPLRSRGPPGADLTGFFLPEPLSKTVTFPCGAQVKLCFHWLFSNMMYVCAKLQPPPAHIADTRLLLCQRTVSPPAEMPVPFPSIPTISFPWGRVGRRSMVSRRGPEGWKRLNLHGQGSSSLQTLMQIILTTNTSLSVSSTYRCLADCLPCS